MNNGEVILGDETAVENVHVRSLTAMSSPEQVKEAYPATQKSIATVKSGRVAVRTALVPNHDNKVITVLGPCSIHDRQAALEYASWLKEKREIYGDELELVMRTYFEKPRTTVGWEGYMIDPHLDESYDINMGLRLSRKLIGDITNMGVPVAAELLDTTTPQYFAGLVSWGAIGARTTESPLHRKLASGLSFPVGFKNSTDGNVNIAIDAIETARHPHHFPAITDEGRAAIASTSGNPDCHIILRGGADRPNYDEVSVNWATEQLKKVGRQPVVMVDFSHANSGKDASNQQKVAIEISRQIRQGSTAIMGVMIESNLKAGAQPFNPGGPHEYGKSITDECIDLEETAMILDLLQEAVQQRKKI